MMKIKRVLILDCDFFVLARGSFGITFLTKGEARGHKFRFHVVCVLMQRTENPCCLMWLFRCTMELQELKVRDQAPDADGEELHQLP